MTGFSKNEHLMQFRKSYDGPMNFVVGEKFWTHVKSIVKNKIEFYVFVLPNFHPDFKRLDKTFRKMYGENWDGQFLIPCSYVQFADKETEDKFRDERQNNLEEWKASFAEQG